VYNAETQKVEKGDASWKWFTEYILSRKSATDFIVLDVCVIDVHCKCYVNMNKIVMK
jgi:hypothetical protein